MVLEFQRSTTTQTLHLLFAQATVPMLELYFSLFCLFFYFFLISCQCYDLLLSYHRETKPTQLEHYFQISTT